MTITSTGGGNPIIRVNSTAKNGTLGSQGAIDADQIVLDTSLNSTNNGTITAPLIGRLLILRRGGTDEETKQIIEGADSATTIRVHEDWTVAPTSGDSYDISYVLDDCVALTGMVLSSKTGIYESSRGLHIGLASGGTFAYLSQTDQQAFEIRDDNSDPSLVVEQDGRHDIGFLQDGSPVKGGILHTLNSNEGEESILFNSGSAAFWQDVFAVSFRTSVDFVKDPDCRVFVNSMKIINHQAVSTIVGSGSWEGVSWTSEDTATPTPLWIDRTTVIDDWTITGGAGFGTTSTTISESLEIRNVVFIGQDQSFVTVEDERTWDVVNPTWTVDTAGHGSIAWGAGTGQVNEKFSINLTTVSASGDPISGSAVYVYEGLLHLDLPSANQMYTDALGTDASDVLTRLITSGATTLNVDTSGLHALKAYRYGFKPFVSAITFDEKVTQQITLIVDPFVDSGNEAAAIAAGSTAITPAKHSAGETDDHPLKVIHYDGGAGTIPTVGDVITGGGSSATGHVLEVRYGDNAEAFLVLSGWDGTQFTNNESLSNGLGWTADADTTGGASSFDEEFTWEYQMDGEDHQVVYDYDRARLGEFPGSALSIYKDSIIWGEDEQSSMIYSDGVNYFTNRNANLEQGVWLANPNDSGVVSFMTSDSGSLFVPPSTVTFTLTGLQSLSEVRIFDDSVDPSVELAGVENSGTSFAYNYIYSSDISIYVVIFHLDWKDIRLVGQTLSSADQTIPIQQQVDRVYNSA